jgi:AraC-like DNA-binding protein
MDLRKLYSPIQPTVQQQGDQVTYCEFLPDVPLQKVIYCYWELKTTRPLTSPFVYRVVADGCVDIFFEADKPRENFVMGFCEKYAQFELDKSFHYIGVRFLPTMFPQLFKVSAAGLSNQFLDLASVVPATARFIEEYFTPEMSPDQVKSRLDGYFLGLTGKVNFDMDNRLYGAIELILKQKGVIDIETQLDTGISPRQLRRLFAFYIGDSAKTFSKVVRFQHVLQAKPSTQSLRYNELFFDAGYYDQSHFIKEFKHFSGVTPGKAFGG